MKGIYKDKTPKTVKEWLSQKGDRTEVDLRESKKGLYVFMSDFTDGKEKRVKVYLPKNLQHN